MANPRVLERHPSEEEERGGVRNSSPEKNPIIWAMVLLGLVQLPDKPRLLAAACLEVLFHPRSGASEHRFTEPQFV
eukprot:1161220-Pelagomonas_calceolata.AAC.22